MSGRVMAAATLFLLAATGPAFAQQADNSLVTVHEGFLTGNEFNELSTANQSAYLIGLADGIRGGVLFGLERKDDEDTTWFESCEALKNSNQMLAITRNFLDEHPSKLHLWMYILFFQAVMDPCGSPESGS